jgi:hypothetical protein
VIRKLLVGLVLLWVGYAALRELNAAVAGYDLRDRRPAGPLQWRAGMPPVDDLARFAAGARPLLPAGSRVAFASARSTSGNAGDDAFFRYRWAAYFLPELDLVKAGSAASGEATYALSFRTPLPAARFQPIAKLHGGWVYRVRR